MKSLKKPYFGLILALAIGALFILAVACGTSLREGKKDSDGNYTECYRFDGPDLSEPIEGYAISVPKRTITDRPFVILTQDGRTITTPSQKRIVVEEINCSTLK